MITEDYVSFETAKLLKEKGFNEIKCNTCYKWNGNFCNNRRSMSSIDNEICYQAPTLQMAMKWLGKKYGVFCVIRRHGNKDDGFTYSWNCEGMMGLSVGNGGGFKTAAEACETSIRYCLENLI